MLVTKSEVEKSKEKEIQTLNELMDTLLVEKKALADRLQEQSSIEDENRGHVNDKSKIAADLGVLKSKHERLLLENKRLKSELEKNQAAQMKEVKAKYDAIKKKYKDVANLSDPKKHLQQDSKVNTVVSDRT